MIEFLSFFWYLKFVYEACTFFTGSSEGPYYKYSIITQTLYNCQNKKINFKRVYNLIEIILANRRLTFDI